MASQNIILVFSLLFGFIVFVLGLLVFMSGRKKIISQTFFGLTMFTATWGISNSLVDIISGKSYVIAFTKITFLASFFIPAYLMLFFLSFPEGKRISIIKQLFILLPPIILGTLLLSNILIAGVQDIDSHPITPLFGPVYYIFAAYFTLYIIISFIILTKKYFKSQKINKLQIKYIFFGLLLTTVLASIANLIMPLLGHSEFSNYGIFATIFFIIFTSFAITKHHLFDIKVITTELLIGFISIIIFIDLIFSEKTPLIILKVITLTSFIYLGISLVRSVLKEIKRREQLEKLTKQLEEANIQLKKLDKAKSEFVSIASHQLRTPLTAIKGYVSMALEGVYGKFDDRFNNVLKNVYGSNEELINLVNDLLNLSRIEAGKITLESEMVDIDELLKAIANKLKINADQKGLIINHKISSLPKVSMDRDKVRQVILNLLDNAIKYTQKGEITISSEKQKNNLIVKISDTGMGLNAEEMSNLFMSFKRGESGPKFHTEGSGLGLYIAKKFIDLHKGKIWAESPGKGKGSTFFISLPY